LGAHPGDDVVSTATRKERSRSLPATLRTDSLLAGAVSQESDPSGPSHSN
jgi:hypothetical protein